MAEPVTINANLRENSGKGVAKRLRNEGRIPAIYYKSGEEAVSLDFNLRDIESLIQNRPRLFTVNWGKGDENERECMIRSIQRHPVSRKIIHLDLMGITRGVKIETVIPVVLTGIPVGVRDGGVLQHIMNEVEIRCFPKDIPEEIVVDVSNLGLQEAIHLEEISVENVEWLTSAESTVAVVQPPRLAATVVEEEEEEEEEGEDAEGGEETSEDAEGGE
ncbi:50S ribosomal protein L25 [Calditrichota bacterium]